MVHLIGPIYTVKINVLSNHRESRSTMFTSEDALTIVAIFSLHVFSLLVLRLLGSQAEVYTVSV